MLKGFRGNLLSEYFVETGLAVALEGRLGEATRRTARGRLRAWWRERASRAGPATSVRALFDLAAAPLVEILGFRADPPVPLGVSDLLISRLLCAHGQALLVLAPWAAPLGAAWREAAIAAAGCRCDWCFCFNAVALRLVDARRGYSRQYVEFDLTLTHDEERTFDGFWALMRTDALLQPPGEGEPLIRQAMELSHRHTLGVCRTLRDGVLEALKQLLAAFAAAARRRSRRSAHGVTDVAGLFEQSLTVVYRILFLLFAEARGLVPLWHRVYRDSYTIESLRALAEQPGHPHGLWEALQAIARLAHAGCRIADLEVTAFNGRLFSPARTPLADTLAVDDRVAQHVLTALSTHPGVPAARTLRGGVEAGVPAARTLRGGVRGDGWRRARIAYRDLDVEQLGAVYEHVLEYEPHELEQPHRSTALGTTEVSRSPHDPARGDPEPERSKRRRRGVELRHGSERRKATGTFYTPRSITEYLVRRTLQPLVEGVAPDAILQLRIVDPAMGSGAFLVAALRYLAAAYETALIRDGECHPQDIGAEERAQFRRRIAQQCLYGVDVNPVAVQLARLSLWLATLAADRPLTFLDHHLAAGDSLIGCSIADLAHRHPGPQARARPGLPRPGARNTRRRAEPDTLPLFPHEDFQAVVESAVPVRQRIASLPGDTVSEVRAKEQELADLWSSGGGLARWKAVADLWCAAWFRPAGEAPFSRGLFSDLAAALLHQAGSLPPHLVDEWIRKVRDAAGTHGFLHWTLEFPEIFFASDGSAHPNPGFDAVIGNPPWEMMRGDAGDAGQRGARRHQSAQLTRFARAAGIYAADSGGHINQYQLFVERAMMLARRGGRIGLVLPWGLAADAGSRHLRRMLLERCDTDMLVGFDNAAAIFPIHRSVRFLLLTSTAGARTERVRCRFGLRDPRTLDTMADPIERSSVVLTPAFLERLSGSDLSIPHLTGARDLECLETMLASAPGFADPAGWNARFGRELNATDDREHIRKSRRGLPVLGGKDLEPFAVHVPPDASTVDPDVAGRLLPHHPFRRARLAYRDVASATNRLTLIAAIVPAGVVTVHTVFCLRNPPDLMAQHFLCGILNSFAANFYIRQHVMTHVTAGLVHRLPVPKPPRDAREFREIARLSRELSRHSASGATHARLQARAAGMYGLSMDQFAHILSTFPLVPADDRQRALDAFAGVGLDSGRGREP